MTTPTQPTPGALPEEVKQAALRAIEEALICHANFGRGKEMTAALARHAEGKKP